MRARETTAVRTNRTRIGNGTARIDTRSGSLRKVAARTPSVVGSQAQPVIAPDDITDADYFVHPFVD